MKKLVIVIAVVLVLSCLASCFEMEDSAKDERENSSTSSQSIVSLPQSVSSETSSKKESSEPTSSTSVNITPSSQSVTPIETDNSRTVYKTPTGKRYHFDPDCGGKNSTATTLNKAEKIGLTPCKKCAN